jgi:hypothetical protein
VRYAPTPVLFGRYLAQKNRNFLTDQKIKKLCGEVPDIANSSKLSRFSGSYDNHNPRK